MDQNTTELLMTLQTGVVFFIFFIYGTLFFIHFPFSIAYALLALLAANFVLMFMNQTSGFYVSVILVLLTLALFTQASIVIISLSGSVLSFYNAGQVAYDHFSKKAAGEYA